MDYDEMYRQMYEFCHKAAGVNHALIAAVILKDAGHIREQA